MNPVKRSQSDPRAAARRAADRFSLPEDEAKRLGRLLAALAAEPRAPTTVAEPEEAADTHLADSLAALEIDALTTADRVADVGSGAGFPGLPLAIALPDASFDLIEATSGKCEVIDKLAAAADVRNARAVPARVEEWAAAEGREAYGAVLARAVAPLAVLVEYAAPLLRPRGVFIAWKGRRRGDEEAAGDEAAEILGLSAGEVREVRPFEGAEHRHLHVYEKVGPTPDRFPRRTGRAAKRPLG
jgi:16S rRNA (guanine527-N7)-methyltransferase